MTCNYKAEDTIVTEFRYSFSSSSIGLNRSLVILSVESFLQVESDIVWANK